MALAKDMDRSAQDQVLELARCSNLFFPLLAQQLMRLHPPGLEAAALRAWWRPWSGRPWPPSLF